jgi:hypothetical protein
MMPRIRQHIDASNPDDFVWAAAAIVTGKPAVEPGRRWCTARTPKHLIARYRDGREPVSGADGCVPRPASRRSLAL